MTGPRLSLPRRHRRGLELYTVSVVASTRDVIAVAYGRTPEQARRRAEKILAALFEGVVVGGSSDGR